MSEAPPRGPAAVPEHDAPRRVLENRGRALRSLISSGVVSVAVVVGYFVLPFTSAFSAATGLLLGGGLCVVVLLLAWNLRSIVRSPYPRVRAAAALATTVPVFLVV